MEIKKSYPVRIITYNTSLYPRDIDNISNKELGKIMKKQQEQERKTTLCDKFYPPSTKKCYRGVCHGFYHGFIKVPRLGNNLDAIIMYPDSMPSEAKDLAREKAVDYVSKHGKGIGFLVNEDRGYQIEFN